MVLAVTLLPELTSHTVILPLLEPVPSLEPLPPAPFRYSQFKSTLPLMPGTLPAFEYCHICTLPMP